MDNSFFEMIRAILAVNRTNLEAIDNALHGAREETSKGSTAGGGFYLLEMPEDFSGQKDSLQSEG